MKTGSITILVGGKQQEITKAHIYRKGKLAINRTSGQDRWWVVTHVPSGYYIIAGIATLKEAKQVCNKLILLNIDWAQSYKDLKRELINKPLKKDTIQSIQKEVLLSDGKRSTK